MPQLCPFCGISVSNLINVVCTIPPITEDWRQGKAKRSRDDSLIRFQTALRLRAVFHVLLFHFSTMLWRLQGAPD
jgi:hypothetical protein